MNLVEITFSPTGGTQKVAHIIGECWSDNPTQIDLCDAKFDFSKSEISEADMVIIALPAFGGRAPAIAIERLKQIQGNGAKCVAVAVYGNRAYEDTLIEITDTATKCGFQVIAAIAAVAEHSILPQYASGRPDKNDIRQLTDFANQIKTKNGPLPAVPGNRPYKKPASIALAPKPNKHCKKCGLCARKCPVSAIDETSYRADPTKCILCMRCVKFCPAKARKLNPLLIFLAALAIKKACSQRKENILFIIMNP